MKQGTKEAIFDLMLSTKKKLLLSSFVSVCIAEVVFPALSKDRFMILKLTARTW